MLYFLADYIQETGRGGRDGQICHCVMFYRPGDLAKALSVRNKGLSQAEQKNRNQLEIDNVYKVCTNAAISL
jgi:superfamily II DNA helicase RecQ